MNYGWRRSPPDPFAIPASTSGLEFAAEVDPRDALPAPYDQGNLGSCTANAVAGAMHYDNILNGEDFGVPARLFIYWNERNFEGTVNSDSGAYGRDGFRCIRKFGAPPEDDSYPYNEDAFTATPSAAAYASASLHRIKHYVHPGLPYARSVEDRRDAFKRLLSNDQTIAFGFSVFSSFESSEVSLSGFVPLPASGEAELGGHEMLLVGYLADYPDHGLVRNSWGTDWGDGGYCLMPWSYICDPSYSDDWRSIYRPAT